MTLNLFRRIANNQSEDYEELIALANEYYVAGQLNAVSYASIKADINHQYRPQAENVEHNIITRYTEYEIKTVLKSHLNVYDGVKDITAHLNLMKQLFGENSSQYRNGVQYNRNFHKKLDEGDPILGQSMPANWADATLELIQDKDAQFRNTLNACKKIYEATGNNNMKKVVQKWVTRL